MSLAAAVEFLPSWLTRHLLPYPSFHLHLQAIPFLHPCQVAASCPLCQAFPHRLLRYFRNLECLTYLQMQTQLLLLRPSKCDVLVHGDAFLAPQGNQRAAENWNPSCQTLHHLLPLMQVLLLPFERQPLAWPYSGSFLPFEQQRDQILPYSFHPCLLQIVQPLRPVVLQAFVFDTARDCELLVDEEEGQWLPLCSSLQDYCG
mmetsp:Transcript_18576/g.25768  ORF Transcript_18576/g.25768 Transcript_18576/m.25768 type:complete len:202 (+) Transcript_18576:214-819(+)